MVRLVLFSTLFIIGCTATKVVIIDTDQDPATIAKDVPADLKKIIDPVLSPLLAKADAKETASSAADQKKNPTEQQPLVDLVPKLPKKMVTKEQVRPQVLPIAVAPSAKEQKQTQSVQVKAAPAAELNKKPSEQQTINLVDPVPQLPQKSEIKVQIRPQVLPIAAAPARVEENKQPSAIEIKAQDDFNKKPSVQEPIKLVDPVPKLTQKSEVKVQVRPLVQPIVQVRPFVQPVASAPVRIEDSTQQAAVEIQPAVQIDEKKHTIKILPIQNDKPKILLPKVQPVKPAPVPEKENVQQPAVVIATDKQHSRKVVDPRKQVQPIIDENGQKISVEITASLPPLIDEKFIKPKNLVYLLPKTKDIAIEKKINDEDKKVPAEDKKIQATAADEYEKVVVPVARQHNLFDLKNFKVVEEQYNKLKQEREKASATTVAA